MADIRKLYNYLFGYRTGLLKLNRLFRWISEIWHWLTEGKIVFMCIFVLISAVTLGMVTFCSETSIRTAGYVLQIIGMVFAVRGLLRVRAHFGQPLFQQLFIKWLKRFPNWKKNVVVSVGTAHMEISGKTAGVKIWLSDHPDQSIEKRMEGIIKNLDQMRNEQKEHAKYIEVLRGSHEAHKAKVAKENKNMEAELRSDMESLHTSDLLISLVGLFWLTVGITLSTMAPELVNLAK